MTNQISKLQPIQLWNYFLQICAIPRPSGKMDKIIQFVKKIGENLNLETNIDKIGNVLIKKPGTIGMENCKTVILQSHLDMVPQKDVHSEHDFEKDAIKPYINGEWITAKNTTLGADNGIGVAATMAILASQDITHPPIEALFTVDEESKMLGAVELKSDFLNGDILLNLDSEDEGNFYIGCAGGINTNVFFAYKNDSVPNDSETFKLSISNLKGGHSGVDIHLGHGNANKILGNLLLQATTECQIRLSEINGGSLHNAIPTESYAVITIPNFQIQKLKDLVKKFTETISKKLSNSDPDIQIKIETVKTPKTLIDKSAQKKLLNAICECPNGAVSMCENIPSLVETSTNLAKIVTKTGEIQILTSQRSSLNSARDNLVNIISNIFIKAGAKVETGNKYPGWEPNFKSEIVEICKTTYQELFNEKAKISTIHAGLECSLIKKIYPHIDMVSFGPTICFPHSTSEKINIESVKKFWLFLLNILKNIHRENIAR